MLWNRGVALLGGYIIPMPCMVQMDLSLLTPWQVRFGQCLPQVQLGSLGFHGRMRGATLSNSNGVFYAMTHDFQAGWRLRKSRDG